MSKVTRHVWRILIVLAYFFLAKGIESEVYDWLSQNGIAQDEDVVHKLKTKETNDSDSDELLTLDDSEDVDDLLKVSGSEEEEEDDDDEKAKKEKKHKHSHHHKH